MPSATECAVRTSKPRPSMALPRRCTKARSSSTRISERSCGSSSGLNDRSSVTAVPPHSNIIPGGNGTHPSSCCPSPCRPFCLTRRVLASRTPPTPVCSGGWAPLWPGFEHRAGPDDPGDGAGGRRRPVGQGDRGSGPLQQSLGNEEAQTHAMRIAVLAPISAPFHLPRRSRRNIWLAQGVQHQGRYPRSVVGDGDAYLPLRPGGLDLHRLAREIDGVLDQIADSVEDARSALTHRLAGGGGVGGLETAPGVALMTTLVL